MQFFHPDKTQKTHKMMILIIGSQKFDDESILEFSPVRFLEYFLDDFVILGLDLLSA